MAGEDNILISATSRDEIELGVAADNAEPVFDDNDRASNRSSIGADDPFYPRQGKTLTWKNVNMNTVREKLQMYRL